MPLPRCRSKVAGREENPSVSVLGVVEQQHAIVEHQQHCVLLAPSPLPTESGVDRHGCRERLRPSKPDKAGCVNTADRCAVHAFLWSLQLFRCSLYASPDTSNCLMRHTIQMRACVCVCVCVCVCLVLATLGQHPRSQGTQTLGTEASRWRPRRLRRAEGLPKGKKGR